MTPSAIQNRHSSAVTPLLAVALGVIGGLALHRWDRPVGHLLLALIEPLGAVWLAATQMMVIPLVIAVLTVAIGRSGSAGRIGSVSLAWILGMLAVAAALTMAITPLFLSVVPAGQMLGGASPELLDAAGQAASGPAPSLRDWLVHLVPTNIFRAAADGNLFALMVGTLLFGAALRSLPEERREPLLLIAEAISEWCFALSRLLLRVLPLAVFALTLTATMRSGSESIAGLVKYVVLLSGMLVVATLVLYPVTVWITRMPLRRFAAGIWPAQLLAFSSRSSVACLPLMLETARGPLGLSPRAANVTLPFAVATFRLNMGISTNFQMLFLLHVYGIHPPPGGLALAVVALTLQSFVTPGIPSGAIWTTTPVYLALGIPLEGVVLTNAVDAIPDLFKTVANVTGDLSLATIVARNAVVPSEG